MIKGEYLAIKPEPEWSEVLLGFYRSAKWLGNFHAISHDHAIMSLASCFQVPAALNSLHATPLRLTCELL